MAWRKPCLIRFSLVLQLGYGGVQGCAAMQPPANQQSAVPPSHVTAAKPAVELQQRSTASSSKPDKIPATQPSHAIPSNQPAQPDQATTCQNAAAAPSEAFIKGQVHVHTARSFDAITPVNTVVQFYADRGYDFLAITDHNHVTIATESEHDMMSIVGVELTYNAWNCDPAPKPGGMCALHTGVLFVNPLRDPAQGRHFNLPFRKSREQAMLLQIARGRDMQGLIVINHPTYQDSIDEALLSKLLSENVHFVEFFNGGVLSRSKIGSVAEVERNEQLWDTMLSQGHRIYAIGGDDAHHFPANEKATTGSKPLLLGNQVWLMVRAKKEKDSIRASIEAGDFYVTTGVVLKQVKMTPKSVYVAMDQTDGRQYVTRFMGEGGHILARVEGSSACYTVQGDEGYVRAVVEADNGTYAWLQPQFLDDR